MSSKNDPSVGLSLGFLIILTAGIFLEALIVMFIWNILLVPFLNIGTLPYIFFFILLLLKSFMFGVFSVSDQLAIETMGITQYMAKYLGWVISKYAVVGITLLLLYLIIT